MTTEIKKLHKIVIGKRVKRVETFTGEGGFLTRLLITFTNNYGASVVCHSNSYGGKDGLLELAVTDHVGNLVYDTPITSDVIGWLDHTEAVAILERIRLLPKN